MVRPRPDGRGDRIRTMAPNNASGTQFNSGNGIQYWGGPVMQGTTNVYVIWYGTWDSASMDLLSGFIGSLGGSPYFNINTGYFDGQGNSVTNSLSLAGSTHNDYSRGTNLGSSDIQRIVADTLAGGQLPLDPNGAYFVLTAADVKVSGFGSSFCGYHSAQTYNSSIVRYAFVGNPYPLHSNCTPQQPVADSPNGNRGADAMASTIAHELDEIVTDPNLNAWYDGGGSEVADKCAWTFGSTYTVSNGSNANVNLGGKDYLIQQNWINASGGFCGMSASPGPDFALWATTNSQSATAGGTTGSYSVTVIPVKGFSGVVNFSFSGLPSGATIGPVAPSATGATFTVSTAANLRGGNYSFGITGTSASLSRPATLMLTVSGVTLLPTTLTMGAINPEPSHVAQPYTVNFAVASAGTPTGQVTVSDGTASCSALVTAGSCTLTSVTAGTKTLTAFYAGDSQFAGATKTASHTVNYGGSLADLASGSGWETTFSLVNLGNTSSTVSLNLFGDPGNALNLPFTYPQGASGPQNASSVQQSMAANSVLLLDTTGSDQGLSVGWADLSAAGNVNAYEIFRYGPSGQEAVVPMETRAGSFALLFDNTSLVNILGTGVALANLGSQPATVPIVITDDAGTQIDSGSIPLAANGHTTFTLATQYPGTAGKRGIVQFAAPPGGGISVVGIRANGNSFTAIPAIQSGTAGGSMAHIAAGGGWRSIFYISNLSSQTSNFTLSFFDDSGNPLSLSVTILESSASMTSATVTQALAAGATLVIEAQGTGSQVALGSAQLTSDHGASGFALFRYDPSGQEATAPLETRNAGNYVLAYDNTASLATGVALANLAHQTATVGVILRDDTGATLQTTTLQLPANGHSAFVLGGNYPLSAGKRGTVEFDSGSAQISVLGIRANGNAFTSIPVLTR